MGIYTNSLIVDTRGPNPKKWDLGFGMNVNIVLMDSIPELVVNVFEKPYEIANRDMKVNACNWDIVYTEADQGPVAIEP